MFSVKRNLENFRQLSLLNKKKLTCVIFVACDLYLCGIVSVDNKKSNVIVKDNGPANDKMYCDSSCSFSWSDYIWSQCRLLFVTVPRQTTK